MTPTALPRPLSLAERRTLELLDGGERRTAPELARILHRGRTEVFRRLRRLTLLGYVARRDRVEFHPSPVWWRTSKPVPELAERPLSRALLAVLLAVEEEPHTTVAEVADDLGVSPQIVQCHLDRLAVLGWVENHPAPRQGIPATWTRSDRPLDAPAMRRAS